MNLIPEQEYVA